MERSIKLCLVGLNARYTHSNLAIKYLKESVKDLLYVTCFDFTINDIKEKIVRSLIKGSYTHIGLSCYIWNIEEIKELISVIKTIDENIKIIVGGPEVSYSSMIFMEENKKVDYLIVGEGEEVFRELCKYFLGVRKELPKSVLERREGKIIGVPSFALVNNLDKLPLIYKDDSYIEKNKYLYYEASRGCPFNCKFCLSSSTHGVRFKSLEDVKKELDVIRKSDINLVKFIDRSFNFNPNQMDIIKYIIANDDGKITYHMELHPSLVKNEFIELMKTCREDLFQFEIGLQTTNEESAREINRVGRFEDIKDTCRKLSDLGMHVHIDLIAGLPKEDFSSFKKSFNDLYSVKPDKIQLGFLKLLKGSRLRHDEKKYAYKYYEKAPYEVISNKWVSYKDLLTIKLVEDMTERYYNEKYFKNSIDYLIEKFDSPWDFFERLGKYYENKDLIFANIARLDLYNILYDFLLEEGLVSQLLIEKIIYDYYKNGNSRSEKFKLSNYNKKLDKKYVMDLIDKNQELIEKTSQMQAKYILKSALIEQFDTSPFADSMDKELRIFIKKDKKIIDFKLEEARDGIF